MKRLCIFIYLLLFSVLCFAQQNTSIRVIGRIPDVTDSNLYQMQVGAFRLFQNASNAAEKLRAVSLNPSYEEYLDLTRVMIRGVSAKDVPAYIERIRMAGFFEVFIKIDPAGVTAAQPPARATAQPSAPRPSEAQSSTAQSSTAQPSATRPSTARPSTAVAAVPSENFYTSDSQSDMPQNNGPVNVFPRTGTWKLTGLDKAGTDWKANIVIKNVQNDSFDGYFEWYMGPNFNYSGKEYFTGQFDEGTDEIFFQGTRLENSRNLALGKYEAYVSTKRDIFYYGKGEVEDGVIRIDWLATKD